MKSCLFLTFALAQPLFALTIQIDYSYDTTNFFNTQAKRAAVESVAKFYGNVIQDTLLRIDASEFPGCSWVARPLHPETGSTVDIPNLVVPLNTIIVYVGARELGGNTLGMAGPGGWGGSSSNAGWFPRIRGRGNPGAAMSTASLKTDHAPWGGSIAFDVSTTWNFSQNQNLGGQDFVKIALHEMAHVLGIGTADSWTNKISGGLFTGAASLHSHGSQAPIQSGGGHFDGSTLVSPAFGAFGMTHGTSRPVLMLPSSSDDGVNVDVASDLDLAAMIDIGWEVSPPLTVTASALGPASASFSWKSSSFFDYKLQRSSALDSFTGGSSTFTGNGSNQSWSDPAPLADTAFYRLARTQIFTQPAAIPAPVLPPSQGFIATASVEPRVVEGCGHSGN